MVQWIYGGDDRNMCIPHHIACHHVGQDNPDGQLSKDKMMEMYSSVLTGTKSRTFVDQIFQKFDSDNSGSIDFKVSISISWIQRTFKDLLFCVYNNPWMCQEFMLATNMSEAGNSEEKLRWAFKMYDWNISF